MCIRDRINTTSTSVKEHIDTLQEYKDYLWSNKDIDPHEIRSMRESILNHFELGENVSDKRRRLSKILDIPYFGRIDFQEKMCIRDRLYSLESDMKAGRVEARHRKIPHQSFPRLRCAPCLLYTS